MIEEQFLTVKEVSQRLSIGRSTVWAWAYDDKFPKPVRLSSRCTRWRLSDIISWENSKASANDTWGGGQESGAV